MSVLATDAIAEVLAKIASALEIPVLLLAFVALLACALEAGRFAAEWWMRRRSSPRALRALVEAVRQNPQDAAALSVRAPNRLVADAMRDLGGALARSEAAAVETALADYELAVQRRLERTRILVRAGPALGLMGTLIPLAPGLSALGHGDSSKLTSDLRTAFAATTIGLLVGTTAYAITLVRTRMYSEDLAELERLGASAADRDGIAHGAGRPPLAPPLPGPGMPPSAGPGGPPTGEPGPPLPASAAPAGARPEAGR